MRRIVLVTAALMLALAGAARADHVLVNVSGSSGLPVDVPLSKSGDWTFMRNYPVGPAAVQELGSDAETFLRDGKPHVVVGSMTVGFKLLRWDALSPTSPPVNVSDYSSAFPCTAISAISAVLQNKVENDDDLSDTLAIGGWQNDVQVSADGRLVGIATDADGRCHDTAGAGLELVDISDTTRPRLFHLTRHFGEAHNVTFDKNRGLVYISSSDTQLNAIDIVDIRTCVPPAIDPARFAACRPKVARYQFAVPSATNVPAAFKDSAYPDGLSAGKSEKANNGCHDITWQGDRLYCAAINATIIFDASGIMQTGVNPATRAGGQNCVSLTDPACTLTGTHLTDQAMINADKAAAATGLPPACPVMGGTPPTVVPATLPPVPLPPIPGLPPIPPIPPIPGVPPITGIPVGLPTEGVGKPGSVTDCEDWNRPTSGTQQSRYEADDFMRANLRNANLRVLAVIRHDGQGTTTRPEQDIQISHESDPTLDGNILMITDERGGGLTNVCRISNPSGGGVWFYDIRVPTAPKLLKQPNGANGVFFSPNTPVPGNCTVHVIQQVPGRNVLVAAWYIEGTHVMAFYPDLDRGLIEFRELGHYIAGSKPPQTWTSAVVGTNGPNLFIQTGDMTRGSDAFSFNLGAALTPPAGTAQTAGSGGAPGTATGAGPPIVPTAANCSGVTVTPRSLAVGRATTVTVSVRLRGRPVQRARVQLRGAGVSANGQTAANGRARFTVTPTRAGVLRVSVPNFTTCTKQYGVLGAATGGRLTG